MLDRDLSPATIQGLNNADAVAAFFASLGWNTEVRIAQTPANLAITNEAVARQIRRLELVADQEGLLQVYLGELISLTLAAVRTLAAAFRNRPGNYLLVLTADYELIDLVLLEKTLPTKEKGHSITQRQVALRPRILTIDRRNPSRVHLRVLRRLTYTERDPIAQYDKLRSAFDVADWSEEHFNNRALFSDHFLRERLPDLPAWADDPKPAFRKLCSLYERAAARWAGKTEGEVRKGLIEPALGVLGFKPQPAKGAGDERAEPDYLLRDAGGETLAACLAYTWGRSLDAKDDARDPDTPDENPGAVVVSVLERGVAPYAVVTNGKHWRLYAARTHSRATNYYEIDLEEVLALDDPAEAFRYFWLLFRHEAFALADGAAACCLDQLIEGSESYARRLGEDLKDRVFEEIFVELAKGFITHLREQRRAEVEIDDSLLTAVFQGTLTLLYRLLFLLYAEARGLLPVAEVRGYGPVSLTAIKREIAEVAAAVKDEAERRLERRYTATSTDLYDRLAGLFAVIDQGDAALNVPVYNGGLFLSKVEPGDDSPEARSARFLLEHKVPDRFLTRALDLLARDVDEKTHALAFIDYKSLGVRQLGSIYEGLLEFKLRVAPERMAICKGKRTEEVVPHRVAVEKKRKILREGRGKEARERVLPKSAVYLENDRRERKATGSYYTPDYVVKHIVKRAVGPVLERKLAALAPKLRAAQKALREERKKFEALGRKGDLPEHQAFLKHQGLVDELFDVKVCDPAMGSGHFLVEAVDFITDRLLDFLNGFPWNPVTAQLAETRETILHEMEEQHVTVDPARLTDVNLLKRHVLKRCIHGVDLNPMAVELAKLSLWLDCFTLGAPLSFLDHHLKDLKGGNSLLGASLEDVRREIERDLFGSQFAGLVSATEKMIEVGGLSDVTVAQVRESSRAFRDATATLQPFNEVLDLWSSQHHGNNGAKPLLLSGGFPEIRTGWQKQLGEKAKPALDLAARLKAEKRFFHWELEFPEVFFARGARKLDAGFDAVIGNPPWIRQESLSGDKTALAAIFPEVFDSVADTHVFFLARGLRLLSPGGRLGMIVPNKWFRAGYGEKLRRHVVEAAPPAEIVDFGHAPIFPDADTFPCIAIFDGGASGRSDGATLSIASVPREELSGIDLPSFVKSRSHALPVARLRPEGWDLENVAVADLLEKIRRAGPPLREYAGKLYRGILTGFNEAFLIDQATRDRLVAEDPACEPVIRKFLRGRDIQRWHSEWDGQWMIFARHGFKLGRYPSIKRHLQGFRRELEPRPQEWDARSEGPWPGRKPGAYEWYEIQDTIDYFELFTRPKLVFQEIAFHSRFALDEKGLLCNNKAFLIPSGDLYLLALLNSSPLWWFMSHDFPHMKDEAIAMQGFKVESLPVPQVDGDARATVENMSGELVTLMSRLQQARFDFCAALERIIGAPETSAPLETFWQLSGGDAEREVRRSAVTALSSATLSRALELHEKHVTAVKPVLTAIFGRETSLERLTFSAYGLDNADVRLFRETAPPRDPMTVMRGFCAVPGALIAEIGAEVS